MGTAYYYGLGVKGYGLRAISYGLVAMAMAMATA